MLMEHNIYRNFLFLKKEKFEGISNKINIDANLMLQVLIAYTLKNVLIKTLNLIE